MSKYRRKGRASRFVPALEQLELRLVPTTLSLNLRGAYVSVPFTPAVADLNQDGWNELLGALNDQQGNLVPQSINGMGLLNLVANGRVNRHTALADFNGDAFLDIVANTYTYANDPNPANRAFLFFNNGNGTFTEDAAFTALNLRGHGETIVVADFNNDGKTDIFLPYYTFPYPPGSGHTNSPQCYLLINDGTGHFADVANSAGVSLSDWPDAALRVEGAQAVDLNGDGYLDLYTGSHLFINNGNLTFTDVRQQTGLPLLFEEGAKFLDWNNDGKLDLLLHHPFSGPHLFEYNGTTFTEKTQTTGGKPFFSAGAPDYAPASVTASFGMNVYDVNNDGREDVALMGGIPGANAIFLNTGTGFERAPVELCCDGGTPYVGLGNGQSGMSFGDINRDGKVDILYPTNGAMHYFGNESVTSPGSGSFTIEVLGPNGEQNQQGRVVRIMQPGATMTRVVDGGSGYMAQTQYPILVGTAYSGAQSVQVNYAPATPGGPPQVVSFTIAQGQHAKVYAPSAAFPNGRVIISAAPQPAPLPPFKPKTVDTIGTYTATTNTFNLRTINTTGPADYSIPYGVSGDIPLVGDWNGDGVETLGVYRPANNTFYLRNTNSPGATDMTIPYPVGGSFVNNISDAGMETPPVGTGTSAYRYNPGGSPWTYSNSSGVAGNGSAFTSGNSPAPEGTQVAFLQWTGSMSQSVNFAAGTYTISFSAAQRANFQATSQTFRVLVDGNVVGTFTPAGTSYTVLTTSSFTVAAGTHTIVFQALNPRGGDNTAFIDQVRVNFVANVGDPGFETPNLGTGDSAYQYNPSGSAWTFSSLSGVAGNGSAFTSGNPPAPEGTQGAFLQWTGSISQPVDFGAGTYSISFSAAQRANFQASSQTFQVLVNGNVVGTFTPAGTSYAVFTTTSFTVAAGTHTVAFQALNPNGGDNTAFIDQVRVNVVANAAAADIPVVGDWNGDGVTTIGVYRPGNSTFHLRNSNTPGAPNITVAYGIPGDIPLAGDWDGNGITTIGVFRPSNTTFNLRNMNYSGPDYPGSLDTLFFYGIAGDMPIVGDWDGDGISTAGVYRPSNKTFYLRNSNTTGAGDREAVFGNSGDTPLAGDWNGHTPTTSLPTVTNTTPAGGAAGMTIGTTPTATFSAAMDPSTLTPAAVVLVRTGNTVPSPATVTYNTVSRTVTLSPASPLLSDSQYTVTILGGAVVRKDLAGNPLAANRTWTFATVVTNNLSLSGASSTTAGAAYSFTVTARDALGNIATGYRGTVRFTSTDPQAVLPANYTFTAADAGVHTFIATLKSAGTRTLTSTDTVTSSVAGTLGGILVRAAAASRLVISAPGTARTSQPALITVTAVDAYGNVATDYAGTIRFSSSSSTAILPPNYTFVPSDGGVRSFYVTFRKKGTHTVTVTDVLNGSITGITNPIVVS